MKSGSIDIKYHDQLNYTQTEKSKLFILNLVYGEDFSSTINRNSNFITRDNENKIGTNSTLSTSIVLTNNQLLRTNKKTNSDDLFKEKESNQGMNNKPSFIVKEKNSNMNTGSSFVSSNILNELNGKQFYYNYQTPFSIKEGNPSSTQANDPSTIINNNNNLERDREYRLKSNNFDAISNEITIPDNTNTNTIETANNTNDIFSGKYDPSLKPKKKQKDKLKESINASANSNISKKSKSNSRQGRLGTASNRTKSRSKSKKIVNLVKKHQNIVMKRGTETNKQLISLNKYSYVFDDVDSQHTSSRLNYTIKDLNMNDITNPDNDFANIKRSFVKLSSKNIKIFNRNLSANRGMNKIDDDNNN